MARTYTIEGHEIGDMESLSLVIHASVLEDYDLYVVDADYTNYLYTPCIVNLGTFSSERVDNGVLTLIPKKFVQNQTDRLMSGLVAYEHLPIDRYLGIHQHCATKVARRALQGGPTP